jgi:hypothetical protein
LPDQTVIFALRLRAVGTGTSQVVISDTPTPIEVLDGNLATVPVRTLPGQIAILGGQVVDTDGDGYPDDLEVRLGTDPNNAASRPEALSIYAAVDLEFATLTNRQYQLEFSTHLDSWSPYGPAFAGTDSITNKLISIKGTSETFWRLRVLP